MSEQNEKLRAAVIESLRAVERRIVLGQGELSDPGYVRESVWNGWLGERSALRRVLHRAGIDPDGVEVQSWLKSPTNTTC